MRRHRLVATALAAALPAAMLAAPAPAAPAVQDATVERSAHVVKTKFGDIYVEVARDPEAGKQPAILTYSPYSYVGAPPGYRRNTDADKWVGAGYTRVWADVVGTGNSGGCWDYGGKAERKTGAAVVEWITKQKWSTGRVGMIGTSYEGTTATATALERPKGLVTIVPQAAISRWYGYSYSGGIRYFWNDEAVGHQGADAAADEGFDTPLAFDFGLAVPPPTDGGENYSERFASTITPCDEVEHTERGYDDTPDYDKFWLERDYVTDARKIDIPVLVAHNWGDWNVKQEHAWDLFRALKNSPKKVLYMGSRWRGHDLPDGSYEKDVMKWMDRWLKGKDNGVDGWPSVISFSAQLDGDGKWLKGMPRVRNIELIAQAIPPTKPSDYQWQLLPHKPLPAGGFGESATAQFPGTGANTELHSNHHGRFNHEWIWFETPPLSQDIRIFGAPKLQVYSTAHRRWVTYAANLIDVNHDDMIMVAGQHAGWDNGYNMMPITRGFHDSRYRNTLKKAQDIQPGKAFSMDVVMKPMDFTVKKEHLLGLNLSTEFVEWMVPKPYPCDTPECSTITIDWEKARTRLILPVVDAPRNPMHLFDMGHHDH